ncbi:MAG TPA: hypothetical protein VK927_00220, partial [Adhaeribacter sp.]|nr:hypothetical protein [Adhaeribacter sp.]
MLAIFTKTEDPAMAERERIITANSTILFLLAYLVNFLAFQGGTVVAASLARIRHVLYPGFIDFKIADSQWRHNDVIFTYSAGPLLCLGIAVVSVFIFFYFKSKGGVLKLLFLWMFLHGFNFFFGSLVAGTLAKGSFWYAVRWATYSAPITYGIAIAFALILV